MGRWTFFVLMFEWLTLLPTSRPLLQTVQVFAMANSQRGERLPRPPARCKRITNGARFAARIALGLVAPLLLATGCGGCGKGSLAGAADLAIVAAVERVVVSGRVIDGDEQPVAGAQVIGVGQGGVRALGVSDSDGRFALRLPTGAAELTIQSQAALPEKLPITAPSDAIEVALRRRVTIAGIIQQGRKHVAGATVTLMAGDRLSIETKSGPDGRFAFAEIGEARYALRVTHDTAGGAYLPDLVIDGKALVVTLQPARGVMVKLVDDHGLDVAGELLLTEVEGPAAPRKLALPGRALVLPGSYRTAVRVAGFLPLGVPLVVKPGTGELTETLRLQRPATLQVTVTGEGGAPIADAAVRVGGDTFVSATASGGIDDPRLESVGELGVLRGPVPYPPAAPALSLVAAAQVVQKTDARGVAQLSSLPAGAMVVMVNHPDYLPTPCNVELTAGAMATLACPLQRGVTVSGRVLDEASNPIAGALLTSPEGSTSATSDRDGHFTIRVAPTQKTLTATAVGFAPVAQSIGPEPLTFVLGAARDRLAGQVEDERGRIIAGAEVRIGERRSSSDARGQFSLEGLGRPPWQLEIRHKEFAPLRQRVTSGERGEIQRFVMPFGGGIEGRVTASGPESLRGKITLEIAIGGEREIVKPLDDGTYRRVGLAVGRATIRALAPGYVTESRYVDILPADSFGEVTVRDIDFQLDLALVISGRVRRADGSTAAGATIEAAGQRTTADRDGNYTLAGVPAGKHLVTAKLDGAEATASSDGRAGDQITLDLELDASP